MLITYLLEDVYMIGDERVASVAGNVGMVSEIGGLVAEILGAPAQLQVSRTSGTTIFDQNLVVPGVQFEPLTVAADRAVDI